MNKRTFRFLALILTLIMLIPLAASCDVPEETDTESNTTITEGSETEQETPSQGTVSTETEETASEGVETTDGETVTETETADETDPVLEGPNAELISLAYALANGVNAYFPNAERESFLIENQNMSLDYALKHYDDQQVKFIKNKEGASYIENTMDVFVKMKNGNTFYASKSGNSTLPNLYRMGYYFYEMRLEDQRFVTDIAAGESFDISLSKDTVRSNGVKCRNVEDGSLYGMISDAKDPYIYFNSARYSADKFNYLQLTIKNNFADTRNVELYLCAGGNTTLGSKQLLNFSISPSDKYVTYYIPLYSIADYFGDVTNFRLDINGKKNEDFNILELKVIDAGDSAAPNLSLNRSFFVFSDKMHHRIQIAAHSEVTDIESIGMITKIAVDTVAKLVVKDAQGEHTSIDGVDWATAEYIGFDIKDAGIFGYILPKDDTTGKMTVTLEDGNYVILQERIPENGTISPSVLGTENANDFYMGQRIYTDDTHDFEAFLLEAKYERNPINVITVESTNANAVYTGYDALRGVYTLEMDGSNFNMALKAEPNKHYNVTFSAKGINIDRNIYVLVLAETGALECAALFDENGMMLPVPLEVGKNFLNDGEANIYNLDDEGYSDTVFPLYLKAREKVEYTLVNLYQNWGNFPLKQISWIQFHCPYYHLSTGVTESNCIVPWLTTRGNRNYYATLPDHRPMSAPLWPNQPQHTSGGDHAFLEYTDADGKYSAAESTGNFIDSYGPTYADLEMHYITDDGKIKATYTHTEMPQTDENRAYYEMTYEVLEDLTIADFKQDFSFYSVDPNDRTGLYQKFGYLNEQNESVIVDAVSGNTPAYYVLGDECPYFDYFNMKGYSGENGYVNLSFLIYNAEFIIGGEKTDVNFIVKELNSKASLSLNLGKVTLKKGDTFKINAIIMPWGSQETDYTVAEPDKNVRDIRVNSLLNPIKGTAVADCELIEESVFLPKFVTTNGKSAEFTISGGFDNIPDDKDQYGKTRIYGVTTRIYGFEKLTAPKIYEKVDGEWVEYVVSSSKAPDMAGNYQYYDGYNVYYDGDGTYSYAFVLDMKEAQPRTFKIVAEDDFTPWPEVQVIEPSYPIDLYIDPNTLLESATVHPTHFSNYEILIDEENGIKFVRFSGNDGATSEAYFTTYQNGTAAVGQYLVMKYRLPATNPDTVSRFEFYCSTVDHDDIGKDGFSVKNASMPDGQWHVLVIDMAALDIAAEKNTFIKNENGEYAVNYLRLDLFNSKVSKDTHFDLAYVGFCDKLTDVFELNPELSAVMLSVSETDCYYVDRNGEPTEDIPVAEPSLFNRKITPAEIYSLMPGVGVTGNAPITENEVTYIRLNSKEGGAGEGYFFFLKNPQPTHTGKYIAVKYRTNSPNGFEIWASTSDVYLTGDKAGQKKTDPVHIESGDGKGISSAMGYTPDENWQYLIIDLSVFLKNYTAREDGTIRPYIMRMDTFGKTTDEILYFDIAYIGFCDDITKALESEKQLETAKIFDGTTLKTVNLATDEEAQN